MAESGSLPRGEAAPIGASELAGYAGFLRELLVLAGPITLAHFREPAIDYAPEGLLTDWQGRLRACNRAGKPPGRRRHNRRINPVRL